MNKTIIFTIFLFVISNTSSSAKTQEDILPEKTATTTTKMELEHKKKALALTLINRQETLYKNLLNTLNSKDKEKLSGLFINKKEAFAKLKTALKKIKLKDSTFKLIIDINDEIKFLNYKTKEQFSLLDINIKTLQKCIDMTNIESHIKFQIYLELGELNLAFIAATETNTHPLRNQIIDFMPDKINLDFSKKIKEIYKNFSINPKSKSSAPLTEADKICLTYIYKKEVLKHYGTNPPLKNTLTSPIQKLASNTKLAKNTSFISSDLYTGNSNINNAFKLSKCNIILLPGSHNVPLLTGRNNTIKGASSAFIKNTFRIEGQNNTLNGLNLVKNLIIHQDTKNTKLKNVDIYGMLITLNDSETEVTNSVLRGYVGKKNKKTTLTNCTLLKPANDYQPTLESNGQTILEKCVLYAKTSLILRKNFSKAPELNNCLLYTENVLGVYNYDKYYNLEDSQNKVAKFKKCQIRQLFFVDIENHNYQLVDPLLNNLYVGVAQNRNLKLNNP